MTTCYINTKKVWNHQQDVYLFGYFDNRKAQSKIIYLQKAIEQSESKEQNVQDQLASVIKVVSIIIVKSFLKQKYRINVSLQVLCLEII